MRSLILISATLLAVPAVAATPGSYAALDKRSGRACIAASGLRDAKVAKAVRFSDAVLMDARVVTGTWPQPHMKGAPATMLCLYNRKTRAVETQELLLPAVPLPPVTGMAPKKDVEWRAEDIGGRGIIDSSRVTVRFGGDGKLTGTSGCNRFAANYQLTGTVLKVYPPLIGTRMACPRAIMTQEDRFRALLETADRAVVDLDSSLTITMRDGLTIRFMPAE